MLVYIQLELCARAARRVQEWEYAEADLQRHAAVCRLPNQTHTADVCALLRVFGVKES